MSESNVGEDDGGGEREELGSYFIIGVVFGYLINHFKYTFHITNQCFGEH